MITSEPFVMLEIQQRRSLLLDISERKGSASNQCSVYVLVIYVYYLLVLLTANEIKLVYFSFKAVK